MAEAVFVITNNRSPPMTDDDGLLPEQRNIVINIPPAAYPAADIVIATLREIGADPWLVGRNLMGQELAKAWIRGEMTRGQFIHSVRNLMILNPTFRSTL
jgi:hypothetical protein